MARLSFVDRRCDAIERRGAVIPTSLVTYWPASFLSTGRTRLQQRLALVRCGGCDSYRAREQKDDSLEEAGDRALHPSSESAPANGKARTTDAIGICKPELARLKGIEGFSKHEIHAFVPRAVAPQTRLVTDDWPSYRELLGVRHNAITLGPMAAHIALPGSIGCFQTLTVGARRPSRTAQNEPPALGRGIQNRLLEAPAMALRFVASRAAA
jgi:hypothetical protein